jgi:choline dehydrogenase-like flavoprotein
LTNGNSALSRKEVILTAGAIDTPKLLLLNGIGPKSELEAHSIEVNNDLPGVGKRLNDHVLTFLTAEVDGSFNDRYAFESNPDLLSEADNHWKRDQTGAFALQQSSLYGGFHKVPGLHDTEDFKALPRDFQTYLNKPAVPDYEFITNLPLWPPGTKISDGNTYMTTFPFLMNPLSEGSVTLRSANVSDKPVISFNYLTHPYDILCFREAIRATWTKLMQNPYIKSSVRKEMLGPKSMSDEDIDEYARQTAGPVWHANGSVRMGKKEDGACVDSAGRVFGVRRLRVADLSVCPVLTNNHTQSTAYLVGATIGDKIVKEWALDKA